MRDFSFKMAPMLVVLAALGINTSFAQTIDSTDTEFSLESLKNLSAQTQESALQHKLNENVAASSKKGLSLRETPGIVSVISSEDIRYSGARDIVDLLRMVPGLDFASDIYFVQGISMRGNWASEGKVLVMVDGIEYNETLYQGVPFGDKFPLHTIARIEIIRGPGSALYGGTAEYGVINIITKGSMGEEGIVASGTYGFLPHSYGRRNIGAFMGKKIGSHFYTDISLFKSQSLTTDQHFVDFYSQDEPKKIDIASLSQTEASNINIGFRYKNTQLRTIYDRFGVGHPFYKVDFSHLFISLKNDIKLNAKTILTPSLSYSNQVPWETNGRSDEADAYKYKINTQRTKANLTALYDISRKVNLTAGGEFLYDFARSKSGADYFGEGKNEIDYQMASVFAQGLVKHRLANFTLGFRYDKHSAFGSAFVPRFALTKRFGNFHFKALYSHAYRAPGIENINFNKQIKPERSKVAELELGYQFTQDMLLAVNLYDIETKDIIIYTSNLQVDGVTYTEDYRNYDLSGTRGVEAIYKIQKEKWNANLTYSLYQALASHTVDAYRVEGKKGLFVAFPAHKLTANGNIALGTHFKISPSLIYSSERYGYTSLDEEGNAVLNRFAPYMLANLFISYDNLGVKGLDLGIGIYDIFNSKQPLLRSYQSEVDFLPGRSREVALKLSYRFSFQPK